MSHVLEAFGAAPDMQNAARTLVGDDLVAAEAIAHAAAEGHLGAQEFIRSCKTTLGEAAVRRARACRLQEGSVLAATMGFQPLAAMGADAATEEFGAADGLEAKVCSAVRRAHGGDSFGYMTPEETRELKRKTYEASLTSEQREQVMNMLLAKLWEDESTQRGKVTRDPSEVFAAACMAFGGDVESVFGANAFKKLSQTFRRNAEQIKKQISKLTALKDKTQEKLDSAESDGKVGMKVGLLRSRVKNLSRRIAKLKKRLDKLQTAKDETDIASKDAKKIESAEASALETAEPKDEEDTEEGEADEVLGAVMVGAEEALVDEIEVFGLTKRRMKKASKALSHLKAQLATAEAAGHRKRAAHLEKRIARLEKRLGNVEEAAEAQGESADMDSSEDMGEDVLGMDADLFGEDEDEDEDVAPKSKKKHVSLRPATRLQDRLSVLRKKLEEAEAKDKPVRARKLKQAIVAVRAQLQKLHDKGAKVSEDDLLRPDEDESYVTKDPGTFKSSSEYVHSYFGFDGGTDRGFAADAAPVVGFFAHRAVRYGVDPEGAFGAEGGIFQRIGSWLSSLFFFAKPKGKRAKVGAYRLKGDEAWVYYLRPDGMMDVYDLSHKLITPAGTYSAKDKATQDVRKHGIRFADIVTKETIAARHEAPVPSQSSSPSTSPFQSGVYQIPGDKTFLYKISDGSGLAYNTKKSPLKGFKMNQEALTKVKDQGVFVSSAISDTLVTQLRSKNQLVA